MNMALRLGKRRKSIENLIFVYYHLSTVMQDLPQKLRKCVPTAATHDQP